MSIKGLKQLELNPIIYSYYYLKWLVFFAFRASLLNLLKTYVSTVTQQNPILLSSNDGYKCVGKGPRC